MKQIFLLFAILYYVDVFKGGVWEMASYHTSYVDADTQAGIFEERGTLPANIRLRKSDDTAVSGVPSKQQPPDPRRKDRAFIENPTEDANVVMPATIAVTK